MLFIARFLNSRIRPPREARENENLANITRSTVCSTLRASYIRIYNSIEFRSFSLTQSGLTRSFLPVVMVQLLLAALSRTSDLLISPLRDWEHLLTGPGSSHVLYLGPRIVFLQERVHIIPAHLW